MLWTALTWAKPGGLTFSWAPITETQLTLKAKGSLCISSLFKPSLYIVQA